MVLDFLTYGFMQRALVTGIAGAICCAMIGLFLVLKRYSLFGDALSHMAFGGIALGYFINVYPIWTASRETKLSLHFSCSSCCNCDNEIGWDFAHLCAYSDTKFNKHDDRKRIQKNNDHFYFFISDSNSSWNNFIISS